MLNFYKMHSLGNDFMVVDGVSAPTHFDVEQIVMWSDRQRGIGFDQLLLVAPPSSPECDFDYVIFNADGSEAEQCGNGTRCVTDFVRRRGLSQQTRLRWHSRGGLIQTEIHDNGTIETWMPEPEFTHPTLPLNGADGHGCVDLVTEHGTYSVFPLSTGNPHGVIFVDDVINLDVAKIGHALSNHPSFPERANIGFCQVVNEGFLRLRVFERGAAETQACGSGACAAVIAGCKFGKLGNRVKVSLPGGKLRVDWPNAQGPIKLIGDSTFVYEGQL